MARRKEFKELVGCGRNGCQKDSWHWEKGEDELVGQKTLVERSVKGWETGIIKGQSALREKS